MEHSITIREAVTEQDATLFWQQLYAYFKRDIFPAPEDEDLAYFLGEEYRSAIQTLHTRMQDHLIYLFFTQDGQDIGFAMPVIYQSEDGKCFIMEFCVYPTLRGNGLGTQCAKTLLDWTNARGARYFELNSAIAQRSRFWARLGFLPNGMDEWGEALMLLHPKDK